MAQEPVTKVGGPDEAAAKSAAQLVYILQAVGFFIGLTWIVAVIVNYVKLDDARGTWVESHFRWQIRTFWFGLLWGVIGAISMFVVVSGCKKARHAYRAFARERGDQNLMRKPHERRSTSPLPPMPSATR